MESQFSIEDHSGKPWSQSTKNILERDQYERKMKRLRNIFLNSKRGNSNHTPKKSGLLGIELEQKNAQKLAKAKSFANARAKKEIRQINTAQRKMNKTLDLNRFDSSCYGVKPSYLQKNERLQEFDEDRAKLNAETICQLEQLGWQKKVLKSQFIKRTSDLQFDDYRKRWDKIIGKKKTKNPKPTMNNMEIKRIQRDSFSVPKEINNKTKFSVYEKTAVKVLASKNNNGIQHDTMKRLGGKSFSPDCSESNRVDPNEIEFRLLDMEKKKRQQKNHAHPYRGLSNVLRQGISCHKRSSSSSEEEISLREQQRTVCQITKKKKSPAMTSQILSSKMKALHTFSSSDDSDW